MTHKKIVYLSHPLQPSYNDRGNLTATVKICYEMSSFYPNHILISPYPACNFIYQDRDNIWVLNQREALLSLADEIWIVGNCMDSEACKMDIEYAEQNGIPWVPLNLSFPPAEMEIDSDSDLEDEITEQEQSGIGEPDTEERLEPAPAEPVLVPNSTDKPENTAITDYVKNSYDESVCQEPNNRGLAFQPEQYQEYQKFMQSEEWKAARSLVMKRANGICEACLTRKATQVHHETYKYGILPPFYMLKAVCHDCHTGIHKISRNGNQDIPFDLSFLPWGTKTKGSELLTFDFDSFSRTLGMEKHKLIQWLREKGYVKHLASCFDNITPTTLGMNNDFFVIKEVKKGNKRISHTEFTKKGLDYFSARFSSLGKNRKLTK